LKHCPRFGARIAAGNQISGGTRLFTKKKKLGGTNLGNPHEDRKIPTKTVVNCLAVFWGVTAMHHGLILAKAFTYPQWQPALEAAPWRSTAKRGEAWQS